MSSYTILLNADYSFLNTISWKNAVRLVVKGKAEVIKNVKDKVIRNYESTFSIFLPAVIRLIKFVRLKFKKEVPITKGNIFTRDQYVCQYCGIKLNRNNATIDHIIPKSRGGDSTWENSVTACKKCNCKKGSRTPNEAKMYLKSRPYKKPTIGEFVHLKASLLGIEQLLEDLTYS